MSAKIPIRTVFDSSNNATGLAEFQSGEFVSISHGGTGLTTVGSAGKVLQSNGTALVFGDKADTTTFVTKADAVASNNAVLALVNTKVEKADAVASNNAIKSLINGKLISNAEVSTGTATGSFGTSSQIPVITVAADGRVTSISNTAVAGVSSVSYNTSNSLFTINTQDGSAKSTNITLQPFDTDDLSEGSTNQYHTTARARASVSGGTGITYNSTTGVISQSTTIDFGLIDGAVGANTEDYGSIA
jgi:hypothetical protein